MRETIRGQRVTVLFWEAQFFPDFEPGASHPWSDLDGYEFGHLPAGAGFMRSW